ncbi:hypothetical protein Q8A73_011705, partial [Channa argus]
SSSGRKGGGGAMTQRLDLSSLSAGSLGYISMTLEDHGFSRWSAALVKQAMR